MEEGEARGKRGARTREEEDAACERAWAKRGKALEIIRREMYERTRDESFRGKRDGEVW
jgi:hypothetical protein